MNKLEGKKILVLSNNDIGLYKFRNELLEKLCKSNEVYISLPNGSNIKKMEDLGCVFINTNIDRRGTNPIHDLKLLLNYIKIIKEINPDIVLTYTIKPNIYGGIASRILKKRYIANITGLGTAVENDGIIQKITILLYKIAFKNIDTVFFQNKENQEFFKNRNIVPDKGKLLPGSGVNLEYFYPMEYPDKETIEFVFIARIMKEKGIDQYLDTAKYIRERYPNTKFHICGFCEEAYEDILKELKQQEVIIYHGMVDDIREILKKVHCTIHPTYYPEGMSNVLLESSASARPIITTNRSGCREIVDDGINGYVVEQQNSQDLIKKVEQFIRLSFEERKQMGLAGRTKVEREFDRQIVVEEYIKEITRNE